MAKAYSQTGNDPNGDPLDPNNPELQRQALLGQMPDLPTGSGLPPDNPDTSLTKTPSFGNTPLPPSGTVQTNAALSQPTDPNAPPAQTPPGTTTPVTTPAPGTTPATTGPGFTPGPGFPTGTTFPTANPNGPTVTAPGSPLAPNGAWFVNILNSGVMSPQAAADQWNQIAGRTTGNQAVYYPGTGAKGSIGLPEGYLSFDNGAWAFHPRGPETPAAPTADNNPSLPYNSALRDQLLKLLDQYKEAPTINDPSLTGASQAFNAATERGAAQNRAALAERAAAEGLNSGGQGSGAFDTGVRSINESAAQANAAHDSQLVLNETQQRRAALLQAFGLAEQAGGLAQNQGQFQDTMGLSYAQLIALLNAQTYNAGANG